jgi:hypothetical protein
MAEMNDIYDSWRNFVGEKKTKADQAKIAALEHFSAQGLAPV